MNYFDLHCDTVYRIKEEKLSFGNTELAVNYNDTDNFSNWYQCFALWINDSIKDKLSFYLDAFKIYNNEIKKHKSNCFSPILAVENGAFIGNDISLLEKAKNDGVFYITLTWNGENQIAGGAKSSMGLKQFGKDAIKEMNNLKLVCDLSHLNSKSFYQVMDIADNVIASHSCVQNITNHLRNLTLEQMKLIKQKNGVIGLSLYPEFLGTDNVFEGFYKHLDFCLNNDLEDNIAIGTDFDGADIPIKAKDINKLYSFLLKKGISNKVLNKIFFENARNYYKNFDK